MGMISGAYQRTVILFFVASGLATTLIAGPVAENNLSATTNVFRAGEAVYQKHCAACHGVNGAGDGPAAVWLYPRPRHFRIVQNQIHAGGLPADR
jgi:mono/diheme cytochrome c family protein